MHYVSTNTLAKQAVHRATSRLETDIHNQGSRHWNTESSGPQRSCHPRGSARVTCTLHSTDKSDSTFSKSRSFARESTLPFV